MNSFYTFYKTVKSIHEKHLEGDESTRIKVESSLDEANAYYEDFMSNYVNKESMSIDWVLLNVTKCLFLECVVLICRKSVGGRHGSPI